MYFIHFNTFIHKKKDLQKCILEKKKTTTALVMDFKWKTKQNILKSRHTFPCAVLLYHLRKPHAVTVVDHAAWTLEKEMFFVVTETDKN